MALALRALSFSWSREGCFSLFLVPRPVGCDLGVKATGRIKFTCNTVLCGLRYVDRVYRYVDRVYRSGQSGR